MKHKIKRLFRDTVYRMRTVGATPGRQAIALGIGVFVGCTPLFGLHLAICLILSRVLRLSPVTMYAGAQISYPVFAPFLYFAELQTGSLVRHGEWIGLTMSDMRAMSHHEFMELLLSLLGDLVAGSLVCGTALGAAFGVAGYQLFTRTASEPDKLRVAGAVSRRYLEASIFDWEYARGKIKGDPVYTMVLGRRLVPDDGELVDFGCGRALMIALILEGRILWRDGGWPAGWPPPPQRVSLVGFDMRKKQLAVARHAVGGEARIEYADLRHLDPPACDAALFFDVLHYMRREEQDIVLARAAAALRPGGVLLLREADVVPRWRFAITRTGERIAATMRGALTQRFCFRSSAGWESALRSVGLETEVIPTMDGTLYSNVLIVGRKRAA